MIPIETPSQILSELNRCHGDSSQNIVCNVCDTNRNARKVTIEVPTSATCQTLLGRVGTRLGYALEAFLLYYQEPDGHETSEEGVCLNDVPTQLLQSVVGNNLRQNFYLTLKDAKKDLRSTESNEIIENTRLDVRTKTTGATSIVNNCITSNLSDSKDNRLNYGNYSVPPVVMKSETGYVGLVNQAMTCYLNSLLQTLFMTPEFRNAVYRWEYEGTDEEGVKSIPYQLQRLFLMQQTSSRKSIGTTDITRSFGWDSSDAWHQHDIQELCRVMFDALEKTWKNTEQADFISNLYQGRMKDCVQCLKCNWESARVVAYQDIPLAVKPFGEGKAYSSVEESLTAFCAHELLDGNDQWFCEKCNVKVDAHKSLKFITFPYLLTIHLMRFDFDYNTLRRIKLNHRLSFPDLLDLNQYVVHSESSSESTSVNVKSEEQHLAAKAEEDDCDGICISKESSASESASLTDDHRSNSKGPYLYELFSIMVHSGNASGGHYYAYIKSFEKDQWFSFNDQNVMTITYDDIKKTYGGSSSVYGHYSSSYASSTNAYMLMYRRIDREKNAKFMQIDQFPAHLQRELQKMRDREDSERRQLEMDRSTCKIKLFVFHPVEQKLLESTLAVHMNKTLAEATEIAWELFELRGVVPLNCVRLVKYDGSQDYIDRSFDDEEGLPMHRILGGVKFFYGFDLLLDVKKPDQAFSQYKSGGISIKVFVVDLTNETISFPVTVRATLTQTVGDLRQIVAEELGVSPENLHCVLQTHSELKALNDPGRLLKVEEFSRSNKMFVEASGIESDVEFRFSRLFEVIDHYENTIRIHVQLPLGSNDADCPSVNSQDLPDTSFSAASSSDGTFEKTVSHSHNSDDLRDSSKDEALHVPLHSDRRVNEVASCNSNADLRATDVDSSKTDSSCNSSNLAATNAAPQDLCYVDAKASNGCSVPSDQGSDEGFDSQNGVNSWDMERGDWVNSANSKENVYKDYFRAMLQVDAETKQRSLSVTLDKRITLESLKSCLQSYVGTTANNFEVFRLTGSGEEIEMKRLSESLSMYDDDCQFKVKLGRPLQKGEQRVKIHQLLINDPEPIKFLAEVVISKGMTILQAKMSLLRELKSKQVMDVLPPVERCRLRRKCWKNPGNIYVDTQAFDGQDICLMPNMDLLLEILDAPCQLRVTSDDQLSIYIRRWWPSKYELGSITELIIDEDSSFDLIKKISAFSGIPEENVQFCKITGIVFPYDVSLFEIHSGLSWVPRDNGPPVLKSLSIYADGAVFFYRDKTETVKVLTNDEKRELHQKENARTLPSSSPSMSSWRKERALKIYLDETPKTSSCS